MCPFEQIQGVQALFSWTQERIDLREQFPHSPFVITIQPRDVPYFFSPLSLRSAAFGAALAAVLVVQAPSEALQGSPGFQ